MREISLVQAMREAMVEEMRKDEKVFLIGESIRGGIYAHTEGLVDEFGPDRIMDTPIAETGIAGAAIGASMMGYRPVADLMFADFMYVAGDEIFLKAAQWHFMHGGKVKLPLVFLASCGGGGQLANEHSHTPMAPVLHCPGLKLAIPSTPYDAKGLLKTAIRDNNPVVFMWHKMMMGDTGPVPEDDYSIPFGLAEVKREGRDVTVVANAMMLQHALEAADELADRTSVEVIDPRTFEPLDIDTILNSLEKTNHLVVVDEDTERCGFAGELSAQVMEKGFDLLDAPVARVCAANTPIPGGFLEEHVLPQPDDIKTAIERTVA
ncbi:Acetoin dehydrogenase E1 component beta-subunit (EC [Olavius algarvensis Delta 1 endosymbiont]|nr:Acetoin dehydrogenase E1 component beta-subunit (EC [Olavius algarvensis Delta 1 endosymbiont]